METPGGILKEERERQKKSLDEIARTLKLNIEYLRAIESGHCENIPAEIYTKAYLRFYARELGLDGEHIVRLYESSIRPAHAQKPVPVQRITGTPRKPLIVAAAVVVSIFLVLLFVVRFRGPSVEMSAEKVEQQPAEPKPQELRTEEDPQAQQEPERPDKREPAEEANISGAIEAEAADENIQVPDPVSAGKPLSLMVNATDTAWIEVIIDSGEPREWLLRSGEQVSLTASEKFLVRTGNAGGTRIIFNGKDMGVLGQKGEVSDIVLAGRGVQKQ